MVLGLACALFAALAYGSASVLQGVAARRAESGSGLDPRLILRLARSVPYVTGVSLDLAAFVASLVALRTLPLFLVQSVVASSVGVTAVIAAVVGVRLRGREIASLIVLGAGLLLLATSAQPEHATPLALGLRWGLLASVVVLGAAGGSPPDAPDSRAHPHLLSLQGWPSPSSPSLRPGDAVVQHGSPARVRDHHYRPHVRRRHRHSGRHRPGVPRRPDTPGLRPDRGSGVRPHHHRDPGPGDP